MNTCWKCEKQLPEGQVECEGGCDRKPEADPLQAGREFIAKLLAESRGLDVQKIMASPQAVTDFLRALYGNPPVPPGKDEVQTCYGHTLFHLAKTLEGMWIHRTGPAADRLKDWLL